MVSININNQKRLESLTIDTIDFAKTIVKETEADLKKALLIWISMQSVELITFMWLFFLKCKGLSKDMASASVYNFIKMD